MLFPEFTCNYQKKKIPAPKGEFHLCNVSCSAFLLSYYLYRHWACTRLSFVTENIKHVPISRGIKSITGTRRMWKQKIMTTHIYMNHVHAGCLLVYYVHVYMSYVVFVRSKCTYRKDIPLMSSFINNIQRTKHTLSHCNRSSWYWVRPIVI